jgi:hypothetical protein
MLEITILCGGRPTRVVRIRGLYENAASLMAELPAHCAPADRGTDVHYEFCITEPVAEHRDNGGEYELSEPDSSNGPVCRAWAIHTTNAVTVRSTDYDLALRLYFLFAVWQHSPAHSVPHRARPGAPVGIGNGWPSGYCTRGQPLQLWP